MACKWPPESRKLWKCAERGFLVTFLFFEEYELFPPFLKPELLGIETQNHTIVSGNESE